MLTKSFINILKAIIVKILKKISNRLVSFSFLRRKVFLVQNNELDIKRLIMAFVEKHGIEAAAEEYERLVRPAYKKEDILLAPLSTVRDWIKKTGGQLLEAGKVEEIPYNEPCVLGRNSSLDIVYALSNKPYVAEINDARIFGNSSLIITTDGTALNDNAKHPNFGHITNFAYEPIVLAQEPDRVFLDFSNFSMREIKEGIFLSGLASKYFGHWLPEFLPKLEFLKRHPDFGRLPIIVDADMPQSHFDHLRRLIGKKSLILLKTNESLLMVGYSWFARTRTHHLVKLQ